MQHKGEGKPALEIPLPPAPPYLCGDADAHLSCRKDVYRLNWIADQCQVGSLAGAAHLLNDNAGVLRAAHDGQKPSVEQKGKCCLDFDFQWEYETRKRGLSILSPRSISVERCQKSYHRDNWLVAAKRS